MLLYVDKQVLAQFIFWPVVLIFFGIKAASYSITLPEGTTTVSLVIGGACLAGIIGLLIFNKTYRPLIAIIVVAIWVALVLLSEYIAWMFGNPFLKEIWPWGMSYVLAGVVGILSLEWLTRKLLKLA